MDDQWHHYDLRLRCKEKSRRWLPASFQRILARDFAKPSRVDKVNPWNVGAGCSCCNRGHVAPANGLACVHLSCGASCHDEFHRVRRLFLCRRGSRCRSHDELHESSIIRACIYRRCPFRCGARRRRKDLLRPAFAKLHNIESWTPNRGGLFDVPNLIEMLSQTLFSGLQDLEHRHLRLLINQFAIPYIQACPLPLCQQCVLPIATVLLGHSTFRLSQGWESHMASQASGSQAAHTREKLMPTGIPAASTDMVQEKLLRDLSRDLLQLASTLLPSRPVEIDDKGRVVKQGQGGSPADKSRANGSDGSGKRSGKSGAAYTAPISSCVLQHSGSGNCAEALLRCLTTALTWPDSQTLRASLVCLEKVIPSICSNMAYALYHEYLAGYTLSTLLRVLLAGKDHAKVCEPSLLLTISSIYCRFCLGLLPPNEGASAAFHRPHGVVAGRQVLDSPSRRHESGDPVA